MNTTQQPERFQTVIIGAGQVGLSVGYYLKRQGAPFIILEANDRIGDSWRQRWDSLRLFTPARFDGARRAAVSRRRQDAFPTKDEMADYLERYAKHFELPVRSGVPGRSPLDARATSYLVDAGDRRVEAEHVVVAMANYQAAPCPGLRAGLSMPDIVQLHSSEYTQSGTTRTRAACCSSAPAIPARRSRSSRAVAPSDLDLGPRSGPAFRSASTAAWAGVLLLPFLFRVVFHRILTWRRRWAARCARPVIATGGPLIRVKPARPGREPASSGCRASPGVQRRDDRYSTTAARSTSPT